METVGIEYAFLTDKAINNSNNLNKAFVGIEKEEKKLSQSANNVTKVIGTLANKAFVNLKEKVSQAYSNFKETSKKTKDASIDLTGALSVMGKQIENLKPVGVMAMTKALLLAKVAASGFSASMSAVPAVGQVLENSKNIIMNNLFYPLNQALLPVLYEIMAWVKKNRTTFVQLGQVIANVFKLVVQTIKTVFETVKKVFDSVFQTVFGSTKNAFKSFMDVLNLATLKIAFVVTFLAMLLEPILMGIAATFNWVYTNAIKPFISGFLKGFSENLFPVLDEFEKLLNSILEPFKALSSEGETVKNVMYQIGYAISSGIMKSIKAVLSVINSFIDILKESKDLLIAVAITGALFLGKVLIGAFISAVVAATSSVIAFTVALLANPLTWIALAVLGVVYALVKLYQNWDTVKKAFTDGIEVIKNYFNMLGAKASSIWESIKTSLSNAFNTMYNKVSNFFANIKAGFVNAINSVSQGFQNFKNNVLNIFNSIWERIKSLLPDFGKIGELFSKIFGGSDNKKITVKNESKETQTNKTVLSQENNARVKPELLSGGSGKTDNKFEDNKKITFNIQGEDPKAIADEVTKRIEKDDSMRKKFNDSAFAKGIY
jgi:phage-related protein